MPSPLNSGRLSASLRELGKIKVGPALSPRAARVDRVDETMLDARLPAQRGEGRLTAMVKTFSIVNTQALSVSTDSRRYGSASNTRRRNSIAVGELCSVAIHATASRVKSSTAQIRSPTGHFAGPARISRRDGRARRGAFSHAAELLRRRHLQPIAVVSHQDPIHRRDTDRDSRRDHGGTSGLLPLVQDRPDHGPTPPWASASAVASEPPALAVPRRRSVATSDNTSRRIPDSIASALSDSPASCRAIQYARREGQQPSPACSDLHAADPTGCDVCPGVLHV